MNKFEHWFMKRIIRREIRGGPDNRKRLQELYRMIWNSCRSEYSEDNDPTINYWLKEQFEAAQAPCIFGILKK